MGQIQLFGFQFAPRGWALCQGQILAISTNTALFSLLGTTYGGNGQTTFALPDLRGRLAVGQGTGPGLSNYVIGEAAGVENTTLLITNMPAHTHAATANSTSTSTSTSTLYAENIAGTAVLPANKMLAASSDSTNNMFTPPTAAENKAMSDESIVTTTTTTTNTTVTVNPSGGSQPFSILQPYLCLNYAIALEGVFPSRN